MAKKENKPTELPKSTEEKIKEAARTVFLKKGLAATRTRDIAEEAGINLALLNYYFRSKENLFNLVMMESMQQFLKGVVGILQNTESSLEEKIDLLVNHYLNLLSAHPDLPMFILSEMRQQSDQIVSVMKVNKTIIQSHFFKQIKERGPAKINPIHFFINLIGMCVFPVLAKPMLKIIADMDDAAYTKLIEERKKLVALWIKQMLEL